jgi:hypothetical protein
VEYFAIKDKSMEEVAECFLDEILMRHGPPELVVSDAGKEFVNSTMRAVCKLLKIKKVTTSPYNPRADGLAENQVKTCKDMLSSYVNAYQTDWDKYLSVVAHYYRTTHNDAIGMTPYKALYGRDCKQISTMWMADVLEQNTGLGEYAEDLALVTIAIWESLGLSVYENSLKMQQKHNGGKLQKLLTYEVGQLILIKNIPKSYFVTEVDLAHNQEKEKAKIRAALQNRWRGPYRVIAIVNEITVICLINGREQTVAYKNMRPYYAEDAGMIWR